MKPPGPLRRLFVCCLITCSAKKNHKVNRTLIRHRSSSETLPRQVGITKVYRSRGGCSYSLRSPELSLLCFAFARSHHVIPRYVKIPINFVLALADDKQRRPGRPTANYFLHGKIYAPPSISQPLLLSPRRLSKVSMATWND